jgi:hypothetical protein
MQTYAIHYILLKLYIIGDEDLCFITIIESSIGIADLRHNNPIKQSLNFISVTWSKRNWPYECTIDRIDKLELHMIYFAINTNEYSILKS